MTAKNVQKFKSTELRRLAEERLREETATEQPLGNEGGLLKLHHELQVYQIELEMQNAELRQTRDKLETALEQYSDLYDFAPVGYITVDREGSISRVNFTAADFMGLERSRLIGRRFGRFVGVESRLDFDAFLGKVFVSLVKETCDVPLLTAGNSPHFVQIEAIAAASGQECRIALIDITRKKLINKLKLEAEEIARITLEKSVELALQKVEDAAEEALEKAEGITESPLKEDETNFEESSLKVEEVAKSARLKVEEAAKSARLKVNEATEEARLKMAKAAIRLQLDNETIEVAIQKVLEAADIEHLKVERALKVARRMVLAAETNHDLRLKKELAEAATRSKSQFLANMSHELRTPMTGVLGMLDLVLLGNLEAEQREFIDSAHTSARSLVQILNDILDMTKIETGKLSIVAKPFYLRKCVESTFNILFPAAKSRGLDFSITVAANVPEVMVGDQTRLNQVLTNLAGNAVKFTEQGKVEICVAAGGSVPGGKREVTFTVTDTGIGIPDDKKDLLFRVFSQVDGSHSRCYGGTGLGLAISKEIVELMGGTIRFESKEEVGSSFSFTVPLGEARLESNAPSAIKSLPPETTTAPVGERIPHLLLVEDDPNNRKALGLLLKWANYNLDFAEDGLKAVEMWGKGGYDLVLMDIQMPHLNGFEATRAIREKERERGGHTPIVAMTAHANKEDEEKCLAAGMDAFIAKPIDIDKCKLLIGQIIRQKSCGVN